MHSASSDLTATPPCTPACPIATCISYRILWSHITSVLVSFHWLHMKHRVTLTTATMDVGIPLSCTFRLIFNILYLK